MLTINDEVPADLKPREFESLQYITSMTREVRDMAAGDRFHMLAHLLEMAYIEGLDIMRGQRPKRGDLPATLDRPKAVARERAHG